MTLKERLKGSLICGAIGDALGSKYENSEANKIINFDFNWKVSDDTQLTLATCEAIYNSKKVSPERVAQKFVEWFDKGLLTGLGASTFRLPLESF